MTQHGSQPRDVTFAEAREQLYAQEASADETIERAQAATEDALRDLDEQMASLATQDFAAGNVGLGVDIVEIDRMRKLLERSPHFKEHVFSSDEQAYCNRKSSPETHYALRFAAKEAVLKALGTGFSEGIGVRDIEVRRNAKGKPLVVLRGAALEVARKRGVYEIPLSLSYTHTEAVACAMVITEQSRKAREERVDPREELARQFKETRSMLDDL